MFLMQRTDEVPDLRPKYPFHRSFFRRHNMNFDVASSQSRCDLKPNEACANDNRAMRVLSRADDGAAIRKRSERIDLRLIGAGYRQPNRLGASRQQQPVIGHVLAASNHDFAFLYVDSHNYRIEK